MVTTDKQTYEQIKRVIDSLDAPLAQVLIKVVFLEVQDNAASDIGFRAATTVSTKTSG